MEAFGSAIKYLEELQLGSSESVNLDEIIEEFYCNRKDAQKEKIKKISEKWLENEVSNADFLIQMDKILAPNL